ncbi:MAG: outer membrane beta-barrel protein [Bacteroidales bacterium]|nr:outer membrane beta-barrel protein [Bacteroidales bacterium]
MRKAVLILAALAASVLALRAQGLPQHEFQIEGFGGVGTIQYNVNGGSTSPGFGGGGGFLYTWHFHRRWGLTTGLEAAYYQGSLFYPYDGGALSGRWDSSDRLFVSYLVGLAEKQKYAQMLIPVMLQYMSPLGEGGHYFYLAGGFKLGFRLAGSYSQSALTLHHSQQEIVHNYDFVLPWSEEAAGMEDPYVFYQQVGGLSPSPDMVSGEGYTASGKFGKTFGFDAALEFGVRWQLPSNLALYTGVFLDAGLVSLADGGGEILSYDGASSSALTSAAAPAPEVKISDENGSKRIIATVPTATENLTTRPKTIGFGLKARLAFGKGEIRRRVEPATLPAPDTTTPAPVVIIDTVRAQTVVLTDTVKVAPVVVTDVTLLRDTVTVIREVPAE